MGDDTENSTELDDETGGEAAEDEPCRPLLCWADDELGYIWDWEPGSRVMGLFADLHDFEGIGGKSFLSVGVPSESDIASGLDDYRAPSADAATHEVIVLTRKDIDPLADAAEALRENPSAPLDEMVAGMLEAMVLFMEAESRRAVFLFARTL